MQPPAQPAFTSTYGAHMQHFSIQRHCIVAAQLQIPSTLRLGFSRMGTPYAAGRRQSLNWDAEHSDAEQRDARVSLRAGLGAWQHVSVERRAHTKKWIMTVLRR